MEVRLAIRPAKHQTQVLGGAGRILFWPEGLTPVEARQWWANLTVEARNLRASRRPRRSGRESQGGASIFVPFRTLATSRQSGEKQCGQTSLPRPAHTSTEAQPMKFPKPMIILGQIQQVTEQRR